MSPGCFGVGPHEDGSFLAPVSVADIDAERARSVVDPGGGR